MYNKISGHLFIILTEGSLCFVVDALVVAIVVLRLRPVLADGSCIPLDDGEWWVVPTLSFVYGTFCSAVDSSDKWCLMSLRLGFVQDMAPIWGLC